LVLIEMQCKVLIGLVTSVSVPVMKFCEKGDETWDYTGTGCFFMQLFEAARETVPWNFCSDCILSYKARRSSTLSHNTNLKFTDLNLRIGIPIANTRLRTRLWHEIL